MHRFVNLTFVTTLTFVEVAFSPHMLADDVDERLEDDPVWLALEDEWKREIRPVLQVLLCEPQPLLDPMPAFRDAREALAKHIGRLAESNNNQFETELLAKLQPFLSDGRVGSDDLEESLVSLREFLEDVTSESPRVELYLELANAIESFLFLAPWEEKYKSRADYKLLLEDLRESLIDYAAAPRSAVEREKLGRTVGLLEAFAESDTSVDIERLRHAVKLVCKKPNLFVQVSEKLINDFAKSNVAPIDESQSVRDCILGTSIYGTARVRATVRISLREAWDHAALTVHLDGQAHSNTVGYQKPVRIVSQSVSDFWTLKYVSVPSFLSGSATATACTDTTICSIEKMGRQCLSRLIERIARKRAFQQKSQAETIASQRLSHRVATSFDQRLDPALAKVRAFYHEEFQSPLERLGIFPELKYSSTPCLVRVGATFAKPDQIGAPSPPTSQSASIQGDLKVSVHDSFFWNVFDSDRVPSGAFDRLAEEFLTNLPWGGVSRSTQEEDLQLFKIISEAMMKPESERARFLSERLPKSSKLEFGDVLYEDGWITIHWRLRQ